MPTDIRIYENVVGGVIINQIATFGSGVRSFTIKNIGTVDATITWFDGSVSYLRANGCKLSREPMVNGIQSFVINATGTTVDFQITGIPYTQITFTDPIVTGDLAITFDDIANADLLVGDASDVDDWVAFFDLPTYGTPFTSVVVAGNVVTLTGVTGITIKENLFYGNANILSVTDTGCVVQINNLAFGLCSSLAQVDFQVCTITTGVPSEGISGVFCLCVALTDVSMPLCTTLGAHTFYVCTALINLVLPFDDYTELGFAVFGGCESMTSFSFPNVTTVGDVCFYQCYLITTLEIPKLISCGIMAFQLMFSIESFDFPLLETVGAVAFGNCYSVTSFSFPKLTKTLYATFGNCTSAVSFDFPLLTDVGEYTFSDCDSMATLSLPSCVHMGETVLDNFVFVNLSGLTITLTIPSALMTCNGGNPDGDIQYLQANNTVTIIQV